MNVHPAVLERIARHQVEYAPVSLDRPFDVWWPGGQVSGGQGQKPDTKALEVAKDVVWWRRLAYFATVGLTLFIGLFTLRLVWSGADVCSERSRISLQRLVLRDRSVEPGACWVRERTTPGQGHDARSCPRSG